ncbi:hypothetical protein ACWD48_11970 [Streptomyces sp. NPDC002519]
MTAPISRRSSLPPSTSSTGRNAKSASLPGGHLRGAEQAAESRDEGDRSAMHVDAALSPRGGVPELPAPADLPAGGLRILQLLASGRLNAEIAKSVFVSVATVRSRGMLLCPWPHAGCVSAECGR